MNIDFTHFRHRFEYVMGVKKFTPTTFSIAYGCNKSQVTRWKKAKKPPNDTTVTKMALIFGCDRHWLKMGQGQPFSDTTGIKKTNTLTVGTAGVVSQGDHAVFKKIGEHRSGDNREAAPEQAATPYWRNNAPRKGDEVPAGYLQLPGMPETALAVLVGTDTGIEKIQAGDYVIYLEREPQPGEYVVVDGELGFTVFRRYGMRDGEIILVSDTRTERYEGHGQGRIRGVIISLWRQLSL